jgi:hypothetical protein
LKAGAYSVELMKQHIVKREGHFYNEIEFH